MASITFAVSPELKSKISKYPWVNWSEIVKEGLVERKKKGKALLDKLKSEEEQELIRWSVDLGKKAKKDSFRKVLSKLPPKKRKELLDSMPTKKRKEYD